VVIPCIKDYTKIPNSICFLETHPLTPAGWTSLTLTRGLTQIHGNLTYEEQNKAGRSYSCFCRDERTGLVIYKAVWSAATQIKSGLSVTKLQYRYVPALKYNLNSPPSRWLAEWFPIVLFNRTIESHSVTGWTNRPSEYSDGYTGPLTSTSVPFP